jgi:hypothetical protein
MLVPLQRRSSTPQASNRVPERISWGPNPTMETMRVWYQLQL